MLKFFRLQTAVLELSNRERIRGADEETARRDNLGNIEPHRTCSPSVGISPRQGSIPFRFSAEVPMPREAAETTS